MDEQCDKSHGNESPYSHSHFAQKPMLNIGQILITWLQHTPTIIQEDPWFSS
jgi:hypothetical protein